MAQDQLELPCGCIWRGDEHYHQCVVWWDLAARLDRAEEHPNADRELQRVQEQMDRHRP